LVAVDVLNKWRDRVWYLHIKDCNQNILQKVLKEEGNYFDGVTAGVFPELGEGTVDFIAIRNILNKMNYQGWGTVEQDILPESNVDPLTSAKRNRAYLSEKLGW
jgi:inosose dehydratase